ncbi:MAG: hypothetical protein ABFS42_04000 [Candidatus Krumholzibacteriota bacterium]
MNKRLIIGTSLVSLLALILFVAGCGGGDDAATEAEGAATTEEAAPVEAAAEEAAETTTEMVAAHDCAGECGMKAVPEDQMVEIEGKWYCGGCAKHMQTEGEAEGHGEG